MIDFSKYSKHIDEIKDEVKEAAKNGTGTFVKTKYGKYEVKLHSLEMTETKAKDSLMIKAVFKIIAGSEKGNKIWVFKVLKNGACIHFANEFLRSLGTDVDVKFEDWEQYNNMIMDVLEACNNLEFACTYSEGKNGYDDFKIDEVFEV